MRAKFKFTIALVFVVLAVVLPLACKAKPETAGQSATANLTPEQLKQVKLIRIPDQNSPVEISPEQLSRMKLMKFLGPNASLTVFPVRVGAIEKAEDAATASDLARMINDAGLCKSAPAKQSLLLLKASMDDPNEMNKLINMAREFQEYVKKNPPDTDYVLYADYIFTPNWEFVMVHFVVCDRQGEWVIRDLQNSHHADYQSINPKSKEDCNRLVVKRLESWLRDQATAGATSAAAGRAPTDPTEAQQVLDRFLGDWSWEVTTYGAGPHPEENRSTGKSSYARVLGGNFVEEIGEDSAKGYSLALYTYDQRRNCYLLWVFLSKYGGPDTPFKGAWNDATRTIDWQATTADGQSVTSQHHFVSADVFEGNIVARDSSGQTLWRQVYKFTRGGEPLNVSQAAVERGASVLGQTAEQGVLDRLLGTWSWEAPGHRHATGTYVFTRVLDGTFVRGWTQEDAEGNEVLLLYTYYPPKECYRYWAFLSGPGGNDNPVNGTWDETTRALAWTGLDNNQLPLSAQYRFPSDDTFECTVLLKNQAGQDAYRAEYKMTRVSNGQGR